MESASRRQARSESVASPQVRRVALGTASRNRFAGDGQAEETLGFSGLSPVGFGPPLRRLGSGLRSRAPEKDDSHRTEQSSRPSGLEAGPPEAPDEPGRNPRVAAGWFGGRVLVTRISWRGSWFPPGSLPRLVGATAAPVPMVPWKGPRHGLEAHASGTGGRPPGEPEALASRELPGASVHQARWERLRNRVARSTGGPSVDRVLALGPHDGPPREGEVGVFAPRPPLATANR